MSAPNAQNEDFVPVQVPSRIANLGFSFLRPTSFHSLDLPDEQVKFEDPTYFIPLHLCMAGYGAVVFSVAARPAYDDGSVEDWARFHAERQEGEVKALHVTSIAGMQAVLAEAVQPSEAGVMRVRSYFIEDGGRLIILGIMAPDQIWASVETTLLQMAGSFRLESPAGQKAPVKRSEAAAVPAPAAPVVEEAAAPAPAEGEATKASDVALADDAASLDVEHPTNARLRDNGVGLVPRVLGVNTAEKFARLGAGAIQAIFNVPLGWHVIDDGKRTLVFDGDGKVQVNLSLRTTDGDSAGMLRSLLGQHLAEQPSIEHMITELGGMPTLAMRNYRVNDEILEQVFMLKDVQRQGLVLVTRVTAGSEDMPRALNVAEVVLTGMETFG